ncbi:MAG: hypothetical protein RML84_11545 [Anaerolineae bacterium]|nr:hypothetical protein [Anaerolineae bacterium]
MSAAELAKIARRLRCEVSAARAYEFDNVDDYLREIDYLPFDDNGSEAEGNAWLLPWDEADSEAACAVGAQPRDALIIECPDEEAFDEIIRSASAAGLRHTAWRSRYRVVVASCVRA